MNMKAGMSATLLTMGFWASGAVGIECETLRIDNGVIVKEADASGGEAVKIGIAEAKSGPVATVPLPAGTKPGKYALTLRVKFDPADAYSDSFIIGVGDSTLTFMATDWPDGKSSDWRLWTVPVTIAGADPKLVVSLNRSPYYTEPKTKAILLDCVSLQKRGDEVFLVSARSKKTLYAPGEDALVDVKIRNVGAAPTTRTIRANEIFNLAAERRIGQQTVTIEPGAEATARFKWKLGPEEYGREVRVGLLGEKESVADEVSDYFNVADNVWKVAMRAPGGPHMTHPDSRYCDIKTPEAWQKYLAAYPDRLHASYGNFSEWFAWAPDDAFYMTPTEESWISGQACYQQLRSRILDLNRVMNENGVWPITYAKSMASGPPCYEFMRHHPEWNVGRCQADYDQQFVRDWDTQIPGQEKTIFYTWISLVLDITKPKLVDTAINEILSSGEMFGFRGARYDDHYTYWSQPYNEISTRNMQRIFELGKQRNPKFVWGFNYIVKATKCVWPSKPLPDLPWRQKQPDASLLPDPAAPRFEKMPEPYPELRIACENGGYIMNEEARSAYKGSYSDYARQMVHEARLVRGMGGHYGPIPFDPEGPTAFDAIYPDLLRAASRAHTYGDMRVDAKFKQFVTRYSAFIYGAALAPILDPEPVLKVDATTGVWWHMFAYGMTDGGKKRVIVNLLAAPQEDKINANNSGIARKVASVSVTYKGPETVAKAWELSPFISGFQRALRCEGKTARAADFHLWKIVVLELK